MTKIKLSFQNSSDLSKSVRSELLSSQKLTQIIFISSVAVFFLFFTLKFFSFFNFKNKTEISKQQSLGTVEELSHAFPLLVNLKGKTGPQLARVNVYLTLADSVSKKDLLLEESKLEKQLLFLLSGQSIQSLEKEYFYNQIQSQLNAFLSNRFINKVHIQTEMLN